MFFFNLTPKFVFIRKLLSQLKQPECYVTQREYWSHSDHTALIESLTDLYSAGPRALESTLLLCASMMKQEQAQLELSGCFSQAGCSKQQQWSLETRKIGIFHTKYCLLLIVQYLAQLLFFRIGLLSSCWKLFLVNMCTPCWRDSTAGIAVLSPFFWQNAGKWRREP